MRTLATDQASIGMRQPEFEPSQFAGSVGITRPGGARQPVPVPTEIIPVEGIHGKMLCAIRIPAAKGSVSEPLLAERIGDTARLAERAAKLGHGQRIAPKCEVPEYRHGQAVLTMVTDAPISRPQSVLPVHGETMPRIRNVCNRVCANRRSQPKSDISVPLDNPRPRPVPGAFAATIGTRLSADLNARPASARACEAGAFPGGDELHPERGLSPII
jgi:hypothetical protein